MASVPLFERGEVVKSADSRVVLSNVSWAQYEMMLAWRGDKAVPRYAYLKGSLEIMSPSNDHERIKSYVGRIVEAYCLAKNIGFTPLGSWTLRNAQLARGVEADECYVFGPPTKDRPDLAIEVLWTSGGIDKLEIYSGIGVPEVWIVKDGAIGVWELTEGRYRAVQRSVALPGLDLTLVMKLLGEPTASDAMRKMHDWAASR
jgi:Uma2 family endonuclease